MEYESMKILKRALRGLVAAAASAAVLTVSAGAISIGGGIVQGTDLNFRSEPSTTSQSLGTATTGDTVIITGIEGEWYSVVFKGLNGYMFSQYVAPSLSMDIDNYAATINADTVRIREQPGYTAEIMAYVNAGTPVTVIGVNDCWYQVRTAMDRVGYVFCDYVDFDAQTALGSQTGSASGASVTRSVTGASQLSDAALTAGEEIVEYAKQYMGTPYVYGGASPSGFDCSGFVSYVLKNNGYDPTRTSYTLFDQYPHIEKTELQIGDLVFFSSSRSWGAAHVGIYIGNNEFIHSSSGSGYVKINNLDDNYYALHYVGAGRYLS